MLLPPHPAAPHPTTPTPPPPPHPAGDYIGEREDMSLKVMHAYVDAMDFSDLEFDAAIRHFLSGFRSVGGGSPPCTGHM